MNEIQTCQNLVKCLASGCTAGEICESAKGRPVKLTECECCGKKAVVIINKRGEEVEPEEWAELDWEDNPYAAQMWNGLQQCTNTQKLQLTHHDIKHGGSSDFVCQACDDFNNAPAGWDDDD